MQDPASKDLIARLERFTGCQERDLASCRPLVRQLSRDLPTFDSIWLDALVQLRRLTPFQADRLSQGREESLLAGSYQLVSQLMQDSSHVRYLGREPKSGTQLLLEEHRLPASLPDRCLHDLSQMRGRLQRLSANVSVLVPHDFVVKGDSLFVVYPLERGMTVRELLIRRGRFPEKMVKILSQQLLLTLEELSRAGVVHGDLRASNLMLNRRGQITLLNTGLRPYLIPHWTIQTRLPFESYDSFPPEVVNSGEWNFDSDFYSAGCLLWQMACGRPPLHSADPLLKLKAHLTRPICDVREYAPDIDPETAQTILRLTQQAPEKRQNNSSFRHEILSGNGFSARQTIRSFIQDFEQPLPVAATRNTGFTQRVVRHPATWTTAATLFLSTVIGLSASGLTGEGFRQLTQLGNWQLSIANQLPSSTPVEESKGPDHNREVVVIAPAIPLPSPDAQGRLVLSPGVRYLASDLPTVGPLTVCVSTEPGAKPQTENAIIEVGTQPWRIWATELTLQNLTVEYHPDSLDDEQNASSEGAEAASPPPAALLVCQSLNLNVEQCVWQTEPSQTDPSNFSLRAIAWKPLEANEVRSGIVQLSNCQFHQAGSGLMLGGIARQVLLKNCLKSGRGDLVEISDQFSRRGNSQQYPLLDFQHVTLREADSLVNVHFYSETPLTPGVLNLQAENCVFKLNPDAYGLITLTATEPPTTKLEQLNLSGQILLLQPGTQVCVWQNPELRETIPVEFPGTIEGLMSWEIQFVGPNLLEETDSQLAEYTGPRWNSAAPGITRVNVSSTAAAESGQSQLQ